MIYFVNSSKEKNQDSSTFHFFKSYEKKNQDTAKVLLVKSGEYREKKETPPAFSSRGSRTSNPQDLAMDCLVMSRESEKDLHSAMIHLRKSSKEKNQGTEKAHEEAPGLYHLPLCQVWRVEEPQTKREGRESLFWKLEQNFFQMDSVTFAGKTFGPFWS